MNIDREVLIHLLKDSEYNKYIHHKGKDIYIKRSDFLKRKSYLPINGDYVEGSLFWYRILNKFDEYIKLEAK